MREGRISNKALITSVRSFLACEYVMHYDEIPPVQFELLTSPVSSDLRSEFRYAIKHRDEDTSIDNPICAWVVEQMVEKALKVKTLPRFRKPDAEPFNKLFRELVLEGV